MNFNSNRKKKFVQHSSHHASHDAGDGVRDIDMVPMINVVFLLLTFFMIAGVFRSVNPVAVKLPETTITMSEVGSEPNEITVDATGTVSIEGRSYSVDELSEVMMSLDNSTEWVVRADAKASANSVIQVLSAAKAAGFEEVGLQAVSAP